MKRKKHIDDAAKKLANSLRDIDDAIALSNGVERQALLGAREKIFILTGQLRQMIEL